MSPARLAPSPVALRLAPLKAAGQTWPARHSPAWRGRLIKRGGFWIRLLAAVFRQAQALCRFWGFIKKEFSVRLGSTKLGLPMLRNRRIRLTTVLLALVSLLFMQLAVASYVCPGAGSNVAETAAMADASMPCAESMPLHMDDEQSGLCHAHCQTGQASVDKHDSPPPAPIGALLPDFTIPVINEEPRPKGRGIRGHQYHTAHLRSPCSGTPQAAGNLPAMIKAFSEAPLQAPHLQRITAPPISIRNCCFRL